VIADRNGPDFVLRGAAAATSPLIVSAPHTGTEVPPELAARFASDAIRTLPDTDWHLHRLYDFVPELGATLLAARASRYVVDLNRPADGHALYPGRAETGLVPTTTFAGAPIYRAGEEPTPEEIAARVARHWQPYHAMLRTLIDDRIARFGHALLFEAHSIVSEVPRFSAERLPGFMLGDVDGTSCDPALADAVFEVLRASGISASRNLPFKGGHITRAYGRPAARVHALQLEMSQRLYLDESTPRLWRDDLAERLRPVLRAALLAFTVTSRSRS
jgi:N-formylglutamate deformylase